MVHVILFQPLPFAYDAGPQAAPEGLHVMHDSHATTGSGDATGRSLLCIALCLAGYAAAAVAGWPQHGRDLLVAAQAAHAPADGHAAAGHDDRAGTSPPAALVLPFCLLLAAIAILPLTTHLSHWWEHNSSKLLVAGVLGAVTLGYYLLFHRHAVERAGSSPA